MYQFKFIAPKKEKILLKKKVIPIKSFSYTRKPLDYYLLALILEEIGIKRDMVQFKDFFNLPIFKQDPNYNPNDITKYIFDLKTVEIEASKMSQFFYSNLDVKRYFLWEEIDYLKKGFQEDCLFGMNWNDLRKLYKILKSTPHLLCVPYIDEEGNVFEYNDREKSDGTKTLLPELSFENYKKIIDEQTDDENFEPRFLVAICLYDELKKETFEKKHVFTDEDVLFSNVEKRLVDIFDEDAPDSEKTFSVEDRDFCIGFLCQTGAITIDADADPQPNPDPKEEKKKKIKRIYVRNLYLSHYATVKAIEDHVFISFIRSYFC